MNQKTFVLPTFGVELTNELTTLMNPLALAVAIEADQLESVSQERRSAFVELGCNAHLHQSSDAVLHSKHAEKNYLEEPRLIKDVLADPNAPKSLQEGILQTLQDLRDGKLSLS
jgi:hypothetical protein